MKICHLLPWYSPATIGGTEIYILNLSKKLNETNTDVLIICPSLTSETENLVVQGISAIASPSIISFPSYKQSIGIEPPDNLPEFHSFLAEINPDILHFHCFLPMHIFYLEIAISLGIKTVITPHLAVFSCLHRDLLFENKLPCDGTVLIDRCSKCLLHKKTNEQEIFRTPVYVISNTLFAAGINSGYSNKISRLFSTPFVVKNYLLILDKVNRLANAFVVLSPWYKKVLLRNGFNEQKINIILPSANLPPQNISVKETRGTLKFTFIGRLIPEKGLNVLLKAISDIPVDKIELHLFGKDTGMFENEIKSLLSNGYKIYQYGETNHSIVINELKKMDVLCLPSQWMEMAPLVIQEAFAVGIPVIGSNLGGIADAVTNGYNGFLFKHNDVKDLRSKINILINNPGLVKQMKENCINTEVRSDSGTLQMELYKELINNF